MANPEHLAILKQGVERCNRWTQENPSVRPDLYDAELSKLDLREAKFREAKLCGHCIRQQTSVR
jgi:hypothetical protein